MAEELLPDVIMLDMDREGALLETCRLLRANRVLQGLPILMLCDYRDSDFARAWSQRRGRRFYQQTFR